MMKFKLLIVMVKYKDRERKITVNKKRTTKFKSVIYYINLKIN